MRTVVVTPPASLPVTVEEAKRHARIPLDLADDGTDAHVEHLIRAATEKLESMVDRAFVSRTLETSWDDLPGCWDRIRLPLAPVASVESLGYIGDDGILVALDPAGYRATVGTPGAVGLLSASGWPSGRGPVVRYVAGHGTPADVPDAAKLCINILVAHWYDRRELTAQGQFSELPYSVAALADPLRWGAYP